MCSLSPLFCGERVGVRGRARRQPDRNYLRLEEFEFAFVPLPAKSGER